VKKRILLVEDDENISETVALLLADDYTVDTAANGVEAVRQLEDHAYDAVVLDLMMPIMDGTGVKQHIDAAHLSVPVLLMSGSDQLRERALELGIDDFIPKPLDFSILERVLASLVSRRAA
jgi:DNA-binding response OmpR family regulator